MATERTRAHLTPGDWDSLQAVGDRIQLGPGDRLSRPSEPGPHLVVLQRGELLACGRGPRGGAGLLSLAAGAVFADVGAHVRLVASQATTLMRLGPAVLRTAGPAPLRRLLSRLAEAATFLPGALREPATRVPGRTPVWAVLDAGAGEGSGRTTTELAVVARRLVLEPLVVDGHRRRTPALPWSAPPPPRGPRGEAATAPPGDPEPRRDFDRVPLPAPGTLGGPQDFRGVGELGAGLVGVYDLALLDLGATVTPGSAAGLEAADRLVVVVEAGVEGVEAWREAAAMLAEVGVGAADVDLVVRRAEAWNTGLPAELRRAAPFGRLALVSERRGGRRRRRGPFPGTILGLLARSLTRSDAGDVASPAARARSAAAPSGRPRAQGTGLA